MSLPSVQYDRIVLRGGWDLITPTYELTPGRVRNVENFEVQTREGYARVDGYERFNGLPKPSDATYTILQFDSFTGIPVVGETFTGVTSGATGEVVVVDTANSLVAITKKVGAFSVGETVNGTSATTIAAVSSDGTNRVMTSSTGTSWTPVLISDDRIWQGVTWASSLGLFVAVAAAGTDRVMTSSDGATWAVIASAVADTGSWGSITWSPSLSLLVAVALNGKVMTSANGTDWTAATAAEEDRASVTWSPSLGLFVAVGRTGTNRVITSSNGTSWTSHSVPEANAWNDVAWAPSLNLFVAVANTGTNRVMTSSNGTAWASVADAVADAGGWLAVTWSPSLALFVAVSVGTAVMTSSNGTVWAAASAPASFWNDVIWVSSLSLFVAVGLPGSTRAMTSSNGTAWTVHATESNTWTGLVAKEGFSEVLVAPNTAISVETDAQYTNLAADVFRNDILAVPGSGPVRGVLAMTIEGTDEVFAFRDNVAGSVVDLYKASPAGWVQVPFDSEISFTSGSVAIPSDGDLLTGETSGATATVLRVMLETNDWTGSGTGRLIIGAVTGGPFQVERATLGDSATLTLSGAETAITLAPGGHFEFDIANFSGQLGTLRAYGCDGANRGFEFDGTVFAPIDLRLTTSIDLEVVAVSSDGSNRVMTSSNGVIWDTRTSAEASDWKSIEWSPSLFLYVAVATFGSNRVMTSFNGIDWDIAPAVEANSWQGIAWSPALSLFVAVAATGTNRVMTSSNGVDWAVASAAEVNAWRSVAWSPALSLFVAVASDGTNRVMTSSNGVDWTAILASELNGWLAVVWSPSLGLFVAVSGDGTNQVMTSPDGLVWTARAEAEANFWSSITWSPSLSLFVAVSRDGTNRVMKSSAGGSWSSAAVAPEANQWNAVTWSSSLGLFVAVADTGINRVMTSPDGDNWTARTASAANFWQAIVARGAEPPVSVVEDKPKHVVEHKNHLFFSIESSVFNSGPELPYKFASADGAAEQPLGDTVTGFKVQPGAQTTATMAIGARNTIYMLYGTSALDWNMVKFISFTGALDYTMETLTETFMLDDRGILGLTSSERFGNFAEATLTHEIQPFIDSHRGLVATSYLRRERDQYRILFNDGTGLYLTIPNGQFMGAMPVRYADKIFCAWNGELANGDEVNFLGGRNSGFVYEADKGTSFDGAPINAFLHLIWGPQDNPRLIKQYRNAVLEIKVQGFAEIGFTYLLSYGGAGSVQPTSVARRYEFARPGDDDWTLSGLWGQGVWGGQPLGEIDMDVAGSGQNIMAIIDATTDYMPSFSLNSLTFHYSNRRGLR